MKIDFYGDSFTYGYDGANPGSRVAVPFPSYVQTELPQHIIRNYGVNSNDTTKALAGTDGVNPAWSTQMSTTDADAVVIGLCFNDSNDITTTQYQTNLQTMHDQAVAAGKIVVFMTPHVTTFSGVAAYASVMRSLASTLNIGCIDLYSWSNQYFTQTPLTYYVPDGYHPNQTTYDMIGKQVSLLLNDRIANMATPVGQNPWLYQRTFFDEFGGGYTNTNAQGLDSDHWAPRLWNTTDDSVKNYQVTGGNLLIWPDTGFVARNISTDPSILGSNGFAQQYGYFEMRAKLPDTTGPIPQFWMLNHDDNSTSNPYAPEIDVMKCPVGDTTGYWATSGHPTRVACVIHPDGTAREAAGLSSAVEQDPIPGNNLDQNFHVYGVKWDGTGITFYVDGTAAGALNAVALHSPYTKLFLILSLMFGGSSGTPGAGTTTGSTNSFTIDYVRAWQHIDYAVPPIGQPGVLTVSTTPALVFADRVRELGTANGTASVTLKGALPGHQGFANVCNPGDTFYGVIEAIDSFGNPTGNWETGLYTYVAGGSVSRTTVERSSNNNGLVDFGTGSVGVFLSLVCTFAKTLKQANTTSPGVTPTNYRPYILDNSGNLVDTTSLYGTMQFSDEFDAGALNTNVWNPIHMNNFPLQNYDVTTYVDSTGTTRTVARIWPQQDPSLPNIVTSKGSDPQNQFFRRELSTTGPTGFQMLYGYVEYRAKLNSGKGIFPALWQFNDGPQDEVDTMEGYGNADGYYANSNYQLTDFTTTLWHPGGGSANPVQLGYTKAKDALNGGQPLSPPLSGVWHTWGCSWDQTNMKFYFDGKLYFTVAHNGAYSQPQYLIFQMWIGYLGSTAGVPDATNTPQGPGNAFELDWVRVWPLVGTSSGGTTPTPTPTPTPTRNVLQQPFASNSIWNTAIGSGAVFVPANLTGNPTDPNNATNTQYAPMPSVDADIIVLSPTSPNCTIQYSSAGWSGTNRCAPTTGSVNGLPATVPVPATYAVPSSNTNNSAAILSADNSTLVQVQPFTLCNAGSGTATAIMRAADQSITGPGITGSHGGSGLSAIGGTIRLGEMRPGQVGIPHALKIEVYAKQSLYQCTTTSQSFRWPAINGDSYAVGFYGTNHTSPSNYNNPSMVMGSLVAIPITTSISSLNLETVPGKQLAWTMQNYGAYIVDDTYGPGFAICAETGPNGDFATQFQADYGYAFAQRVNIASQSTATNPASAWVRDLQKIINALMCVDNNSATSIGGGGTPLQPPPPSV